MLAHRFLNHALVVLIVAISCNPSQASSSVPLPLRRIEHPSTLRLEILPRVGRRRSSLIDIPVFPPDNPVLHPTDSIRLTLSAFSRTFYLHLRPNHELLHPEARINYYKTSSDGSSVLDHSEDLIKDSVMMFHGDVVRDEKTIQRLREDAAGGLDPTYRIPEGSEGWARIVLHNQGDSKQNLPPIFEGAFSVNGVMHHIVTVDNYLRNRLSDDPWPDDADNVDQNLVIYRDSDILGAADHVHAPSCSHDRLPYNQDTERHPVLRLGAGLDRSRDSWSSFWSKDPTLDLGFSGNDIRPRGDISSSNVSSNFIGDIGSHQGCSSSQKILYMGVAADCAYVSFYGSVQNATTNILKNWNIVSSLYKSTFNVSLGIIELNVQDAQCPSTPDPATPWNVGCGNTTLDDRLSLFSAWRGAKGGGDGAGLWHLMTGCPTGTEIGVAWLGTLCQTGSGGSGNSIVSGTAVTSATRTEWGVISHEIGHNFGAIHDCTSNCTTSDGCCPLTKDSCDSSRNFLMSPISDSKQAVFSQCTLGNVCTAMSKMNTTCLQSAEANTHTTISLQMCGNGIVEAGEDCDPGTGRNSTCCDPTTCKFTSNSVCDPLNSDCCTDSCQFAPATQVCRAARDPACDRAEMCSGTNSTCPADHTLADGTSCGAGLMCASGACTSNSQQCRTVGASMNLTTACSAAGDKSCSVSCQDPNNPSQCIVLQTLLIDGSQCGYGGKCQQGNCKPGTFLDMAKSWFTSNKSISIPIAVVAGVLAVLLLWTLFITIVRHCCCGRRADKRLKPPSGAIPPPNLRGAQRLGSFDGLDQSIQAPQPGRPMANLPSSLQSGAVRFQSADQIRR